MENDSLKGDPWYKIENAAGLPSPALLLYPDRIETNIRRMISTTASVDRLRPHVKTHKMREIIKMQMEQGIFKFKTSTIAETEMVAGCGVRDILLAMQPVGPNMDRFFTLKREFKGANISCIADSEFVISGLSDLAVKTGMETHVWLDINVGMDRTGIYPGKEAARLFNMIKNKPMLRAEGLHVYDGHIHEPDISLRKKICNEAFSKVEDLIAGLKAAGAGQIKIIAGGTPTFPVHALRQNTDCSPGTLLLWDYGYSSSFKDMDYLHAAVLFTRIVSKPAGNLICIDLGHKAVASEMPQPRISLMGISDYTIVKHSEEHMVVKTPEAYKFGVGDIIYGIPWHICPTVDRYDSVSVVNGHMVTGQWNVAARKRKITF
jgi:D-serine deaminase-like pyridoxal phosphate-dependent protein